MDIFLKNHLPKLLAFFLIIINFLPLKISGIEILLSSFDIIIIFYWTLLSPNQVPNWFLFMLGIIKDAFFGFPLGISSLLYIIMKNILLSQSEKIAKDSFYFLWQLFTVFAILFLLLEWIFCSLYFKQLLDITILFKELIVAIAFYPTIHMLFNWARKISLNGLINA